MQIDIRDNLSDVLVGLDAIETKVLPKATDRSLNRVGKRASRLMMRQIGKEAGVAQKVLKNRGFFASAKSSIRTLTFTVIVKWGAIPLKDFNPRQTKKGVTAKAWGSRQVYDGAFIVDKLGRHVFVRKTKKRLPIKKLYGPIPARLAEGEAVEREINNMLAESIPKEMLSNIKFYASKELRRVMRG